MHPETQDGEMFLTNSNEEGFREIGWKSKRKGQIAYDSNGNKIRAINGLFPVFVLKTEVNEQN